MATSFERFGAERERTIEDAVEGGRDEALRFVRDRYERSPNPENNLDFHRGQHTMDVMRRAEAVLRAVHAASPESVSDRDLQRGKLYAAFHDVVQKWSRATVEKDGSRIDVRKRYSGQNEWESAEALIHFMEQWNRENPHELFSREDMELAYEAMDATVPAWDQKHGTVFQPRLLPEGSFVARAVAMADLGTAGIDGAVKFLKEGDAVFREDKLELTDALRKPGDLTDERKEYLRGLMLAWTRDQVAFAEGRRDLFEQEIKPFPFKAKKNLYALFGKFTESIEAARERIAKREEMSFEELAADMGYSF